jgi:thiamine monophosphate synthase
MQELAGMGLSGVAMISGIFGARDITAETSALKAEAVRLFGMN